MTAFIAILSVAVFFGMLWLLKLWSVALNALATSRDAFSALHDERLDDEARELVARHASIKLGGAFVSIVLRGAVCTAASVASIFFAGLIGLTAYEDVVGFLTRWDVVLFVTIGFCALIAIVYRLKGVF
jgi:hypothetical protein